MLKITEHRDVASESLSFVLEGRLAGPWVEELNNCWRLGVATQTSHTIVDLTGVTFVDADGKALLTRMWQQGADLRAAGCSTRCLVDEITGSRQIESSCHDHNKAS